MTRQQILEKLVEIFALTVKGDVAQKAHDESANLATDLGLNSVGMLYMLIAIEEFFNVRFDDVSFGDFVTVGDVVDFIESNAE